MKVPFLASITLRIVIISCLVFLNSCSSTSDSVRTEGDSNFSIAFGSCNHQWEEQPIWNQVLKNKPDLWIWLGDIIYADTEDMSKMKSEYDLQKRNVDYQKLLANSDVIGIWDNYDPK